MLHRGDEGSRMLSGRIGGVHAALALVCALASIVGSLGFINVARAPAVRGYGRLAVKVSTRDSISGGLLHKHRAAATVECSV
jgi:hypothetical protein